MIRTYATFEADAPDAEAGAFDGSSPPPGRPLAEALAASLAAAGVRVLEAPQEHGGYGWEFEVEVGGTRVWCMLQRSDAWLVITVVRRTLGDRLRGRTREAEHQAACEALDRALRAHPGVRDVRWYTRAEFERSSDPRGGP